MGNMMGEGNHLVNHDLSDTLPKLIRGSTKVSVHSLFSLLLQLLQDNPCRQAAWIIIHYVGRIRWCAIPFHFVSRLSLLVFGRPLGIVTLLILSNEVHLCFFPLQHSAISHTHIFCFETVPTIASRSSTQSHACCNAIQAVVWTAHAKYNRNYYYPDG